MRITSLFKNTKKPLVAYLTAGDGGFAYSLECFEALIEGGADLLEVGVPFSDPVADGPIIQEGMQRALEAGTTMRDVLRLIKEIRSKYAIPIVLFSYYNPIYQRGENFFKEAKEAGVDGILIVDLPMEESTQVQNLCTRYTLDLIPLITPSTSIERLITIASKASGFLYYVTVSGTTGMRSTTCESLSSKLAEIKSYTHLPVVAGFGISSRKSAEQYIQAADGFVIGSYFVNKVREKVTKQQFIQSVQQIDPRGVLVS
jgi:tryptophan synthase alpha chain